MRARDRTVPILAIFLSPFSRIFRALLPVGDEFVPTGFDIIPELMEVVGAPYTADDDGGK